VNKSTEDSILGETFTKKTELVEACKSLHGTFPKGKRKKSREKRGRLKREAVPRRGKGAKGGGHGHWKLSGKEKWNAFEKKD